MMHEPITTQMSGSSATNTKPRTPAQTRRVAEQYGINQKAVRKWRARKRVNDLPMGPKEPRSTVLSVEEEAVCVAFRKHILLPLDDFLYASRKAFRT